MPDFILAEHLATRLNLKGEDLLEFERRQVVRRVEKNGFAYYSSRDFYRLKGLLHYMRNKGLSLEEARNQFDSAQTTIH
jgi:DNA-binding transcriptional MerR regulator